MSAIAFKKLKKYYGKVKAVDGITFSVLQGEIFGFLGPNGAGKTTTIRCLMNFIRSSGGEVKIFNLDAQKKSVELKQEIGYLASQPRLYNHWSGEDHIKLFQKIRGRSQTISRLISSFDFDPKIKIKYLSTGNRQKLALILALMDDPNLLILDEPTTGLDPILQNVIYDILRDFKKRGKTVFMSSHNLHEVEQICDRVAMIKEGKIVEVGDVNKIRKKRIYTIKVHFIGKYDSENFRLRKSKIIAKYGNSLTLKVFDDINSVLLALAKYKLKDLEITQAGLEDVFLEYYK